MVHPTALHTWASSRLRGRLAGLARELSIPFDLEGPDGEVTQLGGENPRFRVTLKTPRAKRALDRLDSLSIAEAYLDGEIDLTGDLLAALRYQEVLGDAHPWIHLARRLEPLLLGRARTNPKWIGLHYDAQNAQLFATDRDYNTYTPGVYLAEGDSLERGAERKLEGAFELMGLRPGARLLDVGCGWGGMLRFAARRGVHVTGITLSRHQQAHCEALIGREGLDARAIYQDFFTYSPGERFDAISLMGVVEDLSDYRRVMRSLSRWVRPGGRVYFDFAAERERFGTHSFVTRHVWPGTFRMVFMPEFVEAVRESPFELGRVENDRRNYHLWMRQMADRWAAERDAVVAAHGERVFRTFLLLWTGIAAMMDRPSHSATAFRIVLELPADSDGRFWTTRSVRVADAVRGAASAARESLLGALVRARPGGEGRASR